ncbi:MAG: hypothetical protein Q8L48_25735 [Archangium sp.]|nr:hypothetical protein [Archangium sp.]
MNWLRGTGFRALTALLLGVLIGTPAWAQVAKAPGFKVGEGRAHPFFELDARFDSLAGRFTSGAAASPELIFHFRGGLKFDLDTPATFVNFNGAAEYLWFTGLISPGSTTLSADGRGFRANVALDTKFNRDGVAEVDIGDNLVRSDRTQNPAFAVGVISLFNNLYLAVPIHPGGRALEVTPKVAWSVELFDSMLLGTTPGCVPPPWSPDACNTASVPLSNYHNLNFGLNGRWKFLPKTALIVDVNADYRTYMNPGASGNGDKLLFRAQAGLAGLISPRIAVTLLAGYGGEFLNSSIHTVIGTAEFSYTVTEQSRIAIGYSRNTMAVPRVGTAMDDRGYLRGGLGLLQGRLLLNAQFSADYFSFLGTPTSMTAPVPANVGNDFLLSFSVGPTFTVTSWFDVGASYTLSYRLTVAFVRHEAMLRLGIHY